MAVHLQWVGLACFRLRQDEGPTLAMDPYNPGVVSAACGIADPVIYPRHHTVTFPLPPVGPGRPSIVVLEPPPISLFERGRATPHIENGLEPPAPALRSSHAVLAASASPVHLNRLR